MYGSRLGSDCCAHDARASAVVGLDANHADDAAATSGTTTRSRSRRALSEAVPVLAYAELVL